MARAVEAHPLRLPPSIASAPVEATFVRTSARASTEPVVVLLHSFDSSCLEFRRVLPLLQAASVEAYALDLLGWGFAQTDGVERVDVRARRAHLLAFWEQCLQRRRMMVVATSLGAAALIDFHAAHPDAVHSAVLIDPQGFIDGTPPVPKSLARAAIRFLGSWGLRSVGQWVAYQDIPRCATDDAIRVGRLHCTRARWEKDSIDWLLSGGYSVSSLVPTLSSVECLILWGRQDRVLPPAENVPKFLSALPSASFRWVEDCGHVPHLEQPEVTAAAIVAFLRAEHVAGDSDVTSMIAERSTNSESFLQQKS